MTYKILNTIGGVYTSAAKNILSKIGIVSYEIPSQESLRDIVCAYDIAVIGLGLDFNRDVLRNASNMKIIATATTGLDHVDLDVAEEKGIKVISLRGEEDFLNTITSTAELAMGLLIDVVRFTPWAFDTVKNYRWDRENYRGHTLYEKTLGVVGMGRLGTWMARYGAAFGMKTIFYDPYVEKSRVPECAKVSLDELLKKSDFISIHTHLSNETRRMLDGKAFKKMKKTAYLINTARGEIVDETALLEALESKGIAGYATDVLAGEIYFGKKGFWDHPLVDFSKKNRNVLIVPHVGGMTYEAREKTDLFIAQKLYAEVGSVGR